MQINKDKDKRRWQAKGKYMKEPWKWHTNTANIPPHEAT